MKKYLLTLVSSVLSASILCGCADKNVQDGRPEERTVAASSAVSTAETDKSNESINDVTDGEITVTSAENYAPSGEAEAGICEDPYAAGISVGTVLAHNSYGELLEKYSSIKSEYAYKSTQSLDIINVYTYFERSGDSINAIDFLGEEYIMVYFNGMTYLKCIIDGKPQYYTIFAFADDYSDIIASKYLYVDYAENYDSMGITKYTVSGGDFEFFVDLDASDEFIQSNADFYNVSKGDKVREKYRTDSMLNLKSTSMTIIHPDKSEEPVLSRKLLYNVKMKMPDFVSELASPSEPVRVTFTVSPGTENEYSETISVKKGTCLGTHYKSSMIYTDEKCIQNADLYGKPIESDTHLYLRTREE